MQQKLTRLELALKSGIGNPGKISIIAKHGDKETVLNKAFPAGLIDAFCTHPKPITDNSIHGRTLILPVSSPSGIDAYRSIFTWMLACQKAKKPTQLHIPSVKTYFKATRIYTAAKVLTIETLMMQIENHMDSLEAGKDYLYDIQTIYETNPILPEIRARVGAAVVKDLRSGPSGKIEIEEVDKITKLWSKFPAFDEDCQNGERQMGPRRASVS